MRTIKVMMSPTRLRPARLRSNPTAPLAALVFVLLAAPGGPVAAQTLAALQAVAAGGTPTATYTAAGGRASAEVADEPYRIGRGDVLDIRVFNRPQLSRDAVRVDGRGLIRMPLIEEELQAACRTESELAQEIATRYLKYQRHPQVDVFIKEYNSQPVAVIGAVEQPGRFQLQRRVRLLELLSFAGGPNERAGERAYVVRAAGPAACAAAPAADHSADEGERSFSLAAALAGDLRANPYVMPGDVISVPEAEKAYVVGNVWKPTTITLKEPVTLSRAIAMAGGALPDTKRDKVRIVRQPPGGPQTELTVDLRAIAQRQTDDVLLRAGDIVEVPTSTGRRVLRSLVGAIAPAVSQLPVRVIQ